jgi:hypothetical protein
MNDMVRTLNNVLNPGDAQRLEDQARRNGRPQEERYWRDYRAGLDSPDRYRRDKPDRDRGGELQATSLRERRLVKPVGDTIDCVGNPDESAGFDGGGPEGSSIRLPAG